MLLLLFIALATAYPHSHSIEMSPASIVTPMASPGECKVSFFLLLLDFYFPSGGFLTLGTPSNPPRSVLGSWTRP